MTGERSRDPLQPLPIDDLRRRLASRRLGPRFRFVAEVDSTNDLAWQAFEAAASPEEVDGLVVLASSQRRGRGRRGRRWVAPPGTSMLVSVLLVPPSGTHPVAGLTAAAGCAAAQTIREASGLSPTMKWPNDVLLRGRKVAGVLVEARTRPGSRTVYVAGVGLNANALRGDYPEALRDSLTTIREETGREASLPDLTEGFLRALEEREGALRSGNMERLEEEFGALLGLLGREVVVEGPRGLLTGHLEGISFRKGLRIATRAGTEALPCEGVLSLAPS